MISRHNRVDAFDRIEQIADGRIMVQCIYDVSDVFAQVTVNIPFPFQKFWRLVDEVGGQNPVECAFLISLVKTVESGGKEAESRTDKNPVRFSCLDRKSVV